jgi:creatinine amidohydrolase/Fe(II)-dependent formamide hydrolase-like protein
MKRLVPVLGLAFVFAATLFAQDPPPAGAGRQGQAGGRQGGRGPALPPIDPPKEWLSANRPKELIEFDMMTWPEVYDAIHHQGKTVALYYTGGTEHRGPQNVNGGHTLMAKATVKAIALKLGNAIAMPVLPYTPNNASAQLPGTIGLTNEILAVVLERITEQAIATGFKNVVLMGDHGGGQPAVYRDVAVKLDAKYAPQGVRVFFCDEVYAKAQGDFDKWLEANGYPVSSHAGIPDTSEMLYLGGDVWVRRDLIKTALGDPVLPRGQARDPNVPRVNNGISGDARRSTAELGKMAFDMKVDYAVKQIRGLLETR